MFYLPYICALCYLLLLGFFLVWKVSLCVKNGLITSVVHSGPLRFRMRPVAPYHWFCSGAYCCSSHILHVVGWVRLLQTGSVMCISWGSFRLFVCVFLLICRCWMHNPAGDRRTSVCSAKYFKCRLFIQCNPVPHPPTRPRFHSTLLWMFLFLHVWFPWKIKHDGS